LEGAVLSLAEAQGERPVARVVGLDQRDAPAVAVDADLPRQAGDGEGAAGKRQPPAEQEAKGEASEVHGLLPTVAGPSWRIDDRHPRGNDGAALCRRGPRLIPWLAAAHLASRSHEGTALVVRHWTVARAARQCRMRVNKDEWVRKP